uniref:Ig-like domain-containing protein n=1 Tax=Anopheles farauti TaxID=69004 RepID=A0A182QD57_9DIPT
MDPDDDDDDDDDDDYKQRNYLNVKTMHKILLAHNANDDDDDDDGDGGDATGAARAKIIGSQEVHVKKGSTISLSCVVNVHASSISWYHGSSIVDFDSARGGISLETEKTEGGTSSRLMLTRATLRDSGNYTCVPTGAISASVQVHVLNGEHPAAMQTSSGVPCPTHQALILLFVSLNSCNLSKLIFFISTVLEALRFLLTTTTASFLVHLRHLFGVWHRNRKTATISATTTATIVSIIVLTPAKIGARLRLTHARHPASSSLNPIRTQLR